MFTKRFYIYTISILLISALFAKAVISFGAISPDLTLIRGYIDRNGLNLILLMLVWIVLSTILAIVLYKGEKSKTTNLSYLYNLSTVFMSLFTISVAYYFSNAVWLIDIIWVASVSVISLLVHYLYKKRHINGVSLKKSLN